TLGVVIEVGQVDQGQVGPLGPHHLGGTAGDPLGAGQPRLRPPEGEEGERAEVLFEGGGQPLRRAVNPEDLVAVGPVIRFGGYADLDGGPLVEPPEEFGTAEPRPAAGVAGGLVDWLGLEQAVGLLPEADFAGVAPQPAVADDAVALGGLAGEEGG